MEAFEYDVFISYAHLDNAPFGGAVEPWVDCLHDRLKNRLTQLLGREARIWRDPRLGGNQVFDATISEALEKTAIVVAVLTPRYILSDSCQREIDKFRRHAETRGGLAAGNRHRVFQVVKTEVPMEKRLFSELLGYEFYAEDGGGRMREFGYEQGPGKDRRYWDKLEDLAWDIQETLLAVEQRFRSEPLANPGTGAVASPRVGSGASGGEILYLAETTSDLAAERDSLRREFEQHGYRILPRENLPRDRTAEEIAGLVGGYLAEARLSIHLFGARQGFIPEGGTEPIVRLQHELAMRSYGGGDTRRILWMPKGLEEAPAAEEGQKRFLAGVLGDARALAGAELLRDTIEELKTYIHHVLRPPPEPVVPANVAPESLASVYLLFDRTDAEETELLQDYLFKQRYEVFPPLFEDSPDQNQRYHDDVLKLCDALLIYYNRAGTSWLVKARSDLLRLRGLGRSKPPCVKAVLINGEADFRTNEAWIIRQKGAFSPELLAPFISALEGCRGAAS